MFVEEVQLLNVRSFQHAKLTFSKGINLLIGANNSGKSTLIKSIYNLQRGAYGSICRKEDIRATEKFLRILIKIKDVNFEERKLFYDRKLDKGIVISNDFQNICISVSESESKGDFILEKILFHGNQMTSMGKFDSHHDRGEVEHPMNLQFAGITNMENENNFIYPFFSKRKSTFYQTTGNQDFFSVQDDLRYLPLKVQKISNPTFSKSKKFAELCQDILGFQIGVVPGESNNHNELRLGVYVTDTSFVYLESMGEGVSNIVGLIVNLLTDDRKLYLIEELENDLHPQALKKLLELILEKSKLNQFIISTHSNIVLKYLASAQSSKLFEVRWKATGETSLGTLNISTSEVNGIENNPSERLKLLENLGYDFFDFDLYKSYLFFEESSAERIIKDFLIPEFVPELVNKVKTIAAGGVDDLEVRYIDFHRLFVYVHTSPIYHSNVWVLADGDAAGKECLKKLKRNFKDWDEKYFINFSQDNFENYYPFIFSEDVKSILAIKEKEDKRKQKKELLNKVIEWIFSNKEEAKTEFEISAAEVITILKNISKQVVPAQ